MRISVHFNFAIEIDGKKAISKTSWGRINKSVRKRDAALCYYCGKHSQNGHVDHVIPLSRGGTDNLENLVWSCQECNLSKSDSTTNEWEQRKDKNAIQIANDDQLKQDVVSFWNDMEKPSITAITKALFGQTGGANWERVKSILLSEKLLVQTRIGPITAICQRPEED